MQAQPDRLDLNPPPPPGRGAALALAVAAHLLLAGALAWGVNWKRDDQLLTAEAELWSATVQQAAPRAVEPPPPPPPPPAPAPAPRPAPPPPPPVPQRSQADIAVEREKQRREEAEAKRQREAQEKKQREKAEREKAEKEKAEREKLAKEKAAKDKAAREKAEKAEQARREQQEAQRVAQLREENLRRLQGLAGATGGPSATGTAQRSSGPSDSYAGRIRARVKPNIVFTDDVPGNPVAEVEVRMAPDGTITSRRITKSSGVKAWDDAVLRALDRTEVLPRDTDGRVHSPLLMEFRPKG